MNNENSSKQILLSVLGIAILLIAVVGVSFAFFSYSRVGEKNNVITTGSIFFKFEEGTAITLTNQFPLTDTQGRALSTTDAAYEGLKSAWDSCMEEADSDEGKKKACGVEPQKNNGVLDFQVIGYDGSGAGINYTITAIKGDAPEYTNDVVRTEMNDSAIKLLLTGENSGSLPSGVTSDFDEPALVSSAGSLASGIELATGKITATDKSSQQTDKFELRMWISNDDVTVGAQESTPLSNIYTSEDFGKLYYALKVKIEANNTKE